MKNLTLSLGFLLIILGLASYFGTGRESITALIPAFFGLSFVILAMLATVENIKKHVMHIAAGVALVGVFGTARALPGLIDIFSGTEVARPLAVYAQTAMFLMCLVYLVRAFQSFRAARQLEEN
jgi:uncharacterized membrane protein (UPF0136 family)